MNKLFIHMHILTFHVVYKNPLDYPHKFVVRKQWVERGAVIASPDCTVHDTLEAARASVPEGAILVPRSPDDDPVIVESWML
jgi:hypothetical protein